MSYPPDWVRADTKRFPRVLDATGGPRAILSPLAPATEQADARAFAKLLGHLRATDCVAEEGEFTNGAWNAKQVLNGDQTDQGRAVFLPAKQFAMIRMRMIRNAR